MLKFLIYYIFFGKKNVTSQIQNYFFGDETLIFFYGLIFFSKKHTFFILESILGFHF